MRTRAQTWEQRLAVPVRLAALAALQAMFLSLVDGPLGLAGRVVDWASGAVLVAEAVILLVVAENRRAWIRGHRGLLLLTVLVAAAVVLAVGAVQVLRVIRAVGALRVLRATRVVKAAGALRGRAGLSGRLSHGFPVGAGLLAARATMCAQAGFDAAEPGLRAHGVPSPRAPEHPSPRAPGHPGPAHAGGVGPPAYARRSRTGGGRCPVVRPHGVAPCGCTSPPSRCGP